MPAPTIETAPSPKAFLELPRALYRADPHYVPPMTAFDVAKVDPRRHPFFEHADGEFWIARRGPEPVGRISAVRDRVHDEFHGDRVGFFGHFEAADAETAALLLETASNWLIAHGATELRGPVDFSTNYRCGLLISGEPGPPFLSMPYNPPVYAEWIEAAGFAKAKDLLAVMMQAEELNLDRLRRVVQRTRDRHQLTVRRFDRREFARETEIVWRLYNRLWERNWGFVPMSRAEFDAEAKELRQVLVPDITTFLEKDGEPIAFAVGVPDVNRAIKACNGRLLPFGWWTFMRTMKRVRSFRTMTLGVAPEYRGTGVDALLLVEFIDHGIATGWYTCEASWILEDNTPMLRPLFTAGGREFRRYRIYTRTV